MSTRLNDIANELCERAHELSQSTDLKQAASALANIAKAIRLADSSADEPISAVHRVTFILLGNEDATRRVVRRALNGAGLAEVAFKLEPATKAELEERYMQLIGLAPVDEGSGSRIATAVVTADEQELAALRGLWIDNERLRLEALTKGMGFLASTMAQALTARSDLLARLYRDLTGREISPT